MQLMIELRSCPSFGICRLYDRMLYVLFAVGVEYTLLVRLVGYR